MPSVEIAASAVEKIEARIRDLASSEGGSARRSVDLMATRRRRRSSLAALEVLHASVHASALHLAELRAQKSAAAAADNYVEVQALKLQMVAEKVT